MTGTLRVATVNNLNDLSRWEGRRALLARELQGRAIDLIALQEVANPLGESMAHQLAGELSGYSVSVCPKAGWGGRFEGIAILSRLPVERHETLDLRGQQRTAQFVRVRVGDRPIVFVNGHYYWWPTAHAARDRQVHLVQDWLRTEVPELPAIVCGDFNATPDSPAIATMKRGYASAYAAHHGCEPDSTYPTPLVGGNPIRRALTKAALRLFTNRPGESWRGTLDYLFVSRDIGVIDCEVFLNRPSQDNPGLYPSDHFGLVATLEIPQIRSSGPHDHV